MICSYCGTECDGLPDGPEVRDDDKFIIHGLARCRDALKDQLASMTKRAEESEVWGQDTVCRLTNEKEAAEAKLAKAVGLLKDVLALHGHPCVADSMNRFYEWRSLISQIRALGIDPSKEQEK